MDHGQNGHPGVVVYQIAEKIGLENATTLLPCLVELIVLVTQLKNQHSFVMEVIAVQVNYDRPINFANTFVKDSSDYIGCFRKDTGIYSTGYINGYMTHCKCVGYCNSYNYSLSAAGYYG